MRKPASGPLFVGWSGQRKGPESEACRLYDTQKMWCGRTKLEMLGSSRVGSWGVLKTPSKAGASLSCRTHVVAQGASSPVKWMLGFAWNELAREMQTSPYLLEASRGWKSTLEDYTPRAWHLTRYKGQVQRTIGDVALVKIYPVNDWDRWDAIVPLASFDRVPRVGDEFDCSIVISGATVHIEAYVMTGAPLPSLEDFGIDRKELMDWASKVDL